MALNGKFEIGAIQQISFFDCDAILKPFETLR